MIQSNAIMKYAMGIPMSSIKMFSKKFEFVVSDLDASTKMAKENSSVSLKFKCFYGQSFVLRK